MPKRKKADTVEHDWLTLVTQHGLFISEPVFQSHFSKGLDTVLFEKHRLFKKEWDMYSISSKEEKKKKHTRWLNFMLEELLEFGDVSWAKRPDIPAEAKHYLFEYDQELTPDRVLLSREGKPLLLVMVVAPGKKLEKPESEAGRWKASPHFKLSTLCMETKIPLGLLTNGEEFRVIHTKPTTGTAYFEWKAQDWYDEKSLLDSFYTLLRKERFFGVEEKRLVRLIEESQKRQLDVTDQLGEQMRHALSIFIRDMGDLNKDHLMGIFKDASGQYLYEMSLTVMMRLVFILYSEENELLPHGNFLYENNYGLSHLVYQLQTRATDEDYMRKRDAWPRILALFRLIYEGCEHPDVNAIAYGSELFDPKKYPELEHPRLNISNRTIWNMLRNLSYAETKIGKEKVKQKVSYRTIDVEQIGSVYESLMGYSVESAKETMVSFAGKEEAIRPLSEFKDLSREELEEYLKSVSGKSEKRIKKILDEYEETSGGSYLDEEGGFKVGDDRKRFEKFLDEDGWIEHGQLYMVRAGSARKGSGTYYTPKEITRFLVWEALEPLVYEETEKGKRIRSPSEILSLKVCDPAMGSGAFLVQAIRYLAERLVESWSKLSSEHPDKLLTLPYGLEARGDDKEEIIPEGEEEALQKARLFVAQHCIYGVDLNPMAVELAKVSVWLTTMTRSYPLTFLDHRLKPGNSLIGADFGHTAVIPNEPLWKEQKRQNKETRKNKMLTGLDFGEYIRGILEARKDMQRREISPEDVKQKEQLFREAHTEDKPITRLKRVFDLWCTVWFWPYDEKDAAAPKEVKRDMTKATSLFDFDGVVPYAGAKPETMMGAAADPSGPGWQVETPQIPHPPHTGEYREIALSLLGASKDYAGPGHFEDYRKITTDTAREQRFFHWELEFPEVFLNEEGTRKENPGFDAVVGNPPWDAIQPKSQEFFSFYDSNFRSYSREKAKKVQNRLLQEPVA